MKRILALVSLLLCIVLLTAALGEGAGTGSLLLRLYQAEEMLLLSTGNVTMTGHAAFRIDGELFKTADLTHVQEGTTAYREWTLCTPHQGGDRLTGYSVLNQEGRIDAFESYGRSHKRLYDGDSGLPRTSILRHTVAGDTLASLAELVLIQCGDIGTCTAEAAGEKEEDGTLLTIRITAEDMPAVLNAVLNSVLQYGINRYMGLDISAFDTDSFISYRYFATVSEGLAYSLRAVRLREVTVRAKLDDYDRICFVNGTLLLEYEERSGEVSELRMDFYQTAEDYGTSLVNTDPVACDPWGDPYVSGYTPW